MMEKAIYLSTLHFDRELETKYRDYTASIDRIYIRIAFIVFTLLYATFSIADYIILPQWFELFFVIRFFLVIPLFIFTILITFSKRYAQLKQGILMIDFIISGTAISVMLIVEPLNIMYYGGFFLIFTAGYFMLHVSPRNAIISSVIILAIYIIGTFVAGNMSVTVGMAFGFLIAENILGVIGAFQLDRFKRNEFLNIEELNHSRAILNVTVSEQLKEISQAQVSTIRALALLAESRDQETGEHIDRVGDICRSISEALPLDYFKSVEDKNYFCETISLASALHDIGKVGISDVILNKPAKLTKEEFDIMKTHAEIGSRTLSKLLEQYPNNYFVQVGLEITRYHHEKWDGTGYPEGLKGAEIPLSARIMAVADVYDALVSKRPYKEAYSHDKAIGIMKKDAGKHFDPIILSYFCSLF